MKKNFLIFISGWLIVAAFFAAPEAVNAQKKSDAKQAAKLSAEADGSLKQKDYKTAIAKYGAAIALLPSLAPAHFGKAAAHIALDEKSEAVRELDAALAGGYKPFEIYRLRWRLNFDLKNYDAALEDARRAAQSDPKNAAFYRAIGEIQLAKNSFQEALETFQKYAQANPSDADVYYFTAVAYAGLKDAAKQSSAAEEAVKRNSKFLGESYFLIAEARRENRNYTEAADFYRRAIAAKSDINTVAYENLADIFRRANRFNEAVEIIQKGLRAFPEDANFYVDLGRYFNLAERNAEAIVAAEKAVKLLPEYAAAKASLCRVYYETKQFEQARKNCDAALEIDPNDTVSNVYSGFINLTLKREEAAKAAFARAAAELLEYTRANPDYFDGFFLLGNSFYYTEQPQKAVEAYLKALELNPNFTRARFNLGLAYFVAGNQAAAREQYNALLKTNKDLAEKLRATIDKK